MGEESSGWTKQCVAEELTKVRHGCIEHVERGLDTGVMGTQKKMLSPVPPDVRAGCPGARKLQPKAECVLTCRTEEVTEGLREERVVAPQGEEAIGSLALGLSYNVSEGMGGGNGDGRRRQGVRSGGALLQGIRT